MAGGSGEQFTGFSKYFNTYTLTGRANISKATLATVGLIVLYNVLKPKKAAPAKSS